MSERAAFLGAVLVGAWLALAHAQEEPTKPPGEQERNAAFLRAQTLELQVFPLITAGRHKEALPISEKAVALFEKSVGLESIWASLAINNLAVLYMELGHYESGRALITRVVDTVSAYYGRSHPITEDEIRKRPESWNWARKLS